MSLPIIAFSSGCGLVNKCIKMNCYWNQINRGFIPLTGAGMTIEQIKKIHKQNEGFGNSFIPRMRVEFGTNVNYIVCEDFKENTNANPDD